MVIKEYITRFRAKFLRTMEYHMQPTSEVAYRKLADSCETVEILNVKFRGSPFRNCSLKKSPSFLRKTKSSGNLFRKHDSEETLCPKLDNYLHKSAREDQNVKDSNNKEQSLQKQDSGISISSSSSSSSMNTSTSSSSMLSSRSNQKQPTGGKFRATQLWNDVIAHLKENVEVRRRRLKMRHYDSCFTGSDASEVVLDRLQAERFSFTKDVSRDKAVKLCQLLMEHHVFEAVASSGGVDVFEDSGKSLYRFLEDTEEEEEEESKENHHDDTNNEIDEETTHREKKRRLSTRSSDSDIYSADGMVVKHGQIVQEIMDITGAWKRYSSECLRKLTPAKLFTRRPSDLTDMTPSNDEFSKVTVPPAVEEEVWREVVLGRLLMVVELPILDSILSDEASPTLAHKTRNKTEMAFSNMAFKRQESVCSLFSTKSEDEWMEAAVDCLECLPLGINILDNSLSEDTDMTQKLRLYQNIVNFYGKSKCREPLWSEKFGDLHLSLYNLLMQGKRCQVLKALQLGVILLPKKTQEQLRRLLTFMNVAAKDDSIQLSVKHDNRKQVEESFSGAVLRSKLLTPHQVGQLVIFMMDHVQAVFTCPDDVEEEVQNRLTVYIRGQLPPTPISYCQRVSGEEFVKQQMDETERALVDLINSILDNTDMSLKEKKQRLKQFQKYHPEIFKKHFSEMH